MREKIELHDSILDSVLRKDERVVVTLDAYIHRSEGEPGVASGTGWHQTIRFEIDGGRIMGDVPEPEADIDSGELSLGSDLLRNMIPVEGIFSGSVKLQLLFFEYAALAVAGTGLTIVREGEPEFLEMVDFDHY